MSHLYQCHVRFSDVDVYGHVNNVQYFEYFQEARLAYISTLSGRDEAAGFKIVLARMDVDYKRPILFRTEPYQIETSVSRVGRSSFDLVAQIRDGGTLLSRARAVLVGFDVTSQAARPLADEERALLLAEIDR